MRMIRNSNNETPIPPDSFVTAVRGGGLRPTVIQGEHTPEWQCRYRVLMPDRAASPVCMRPAPCLTARIDAGNALLYARCMRRWIPRWMLCLLVIALAAAPLRVLPAMPVVTGPGAMAHCAGMRHAMSPAAGLPGMTAGAGKTACPHCLKGHGGRHCIFSCSCCLPSHVAIDGQFPLTVAGQDRVPPAAPADHFSNRTSRPLFRPPISRA